MEYDFGIYKLGGLPLRRTRRFRTKRFVTDKRNPEVGWPKNHRRRHIDARRPSFQAHARERLATWRPGCPRAGRAVGATATRHGSATTDEGRDRARAASVGWASAPWTGPGPTGPVRAGRGRFRPDQIRSDGTALARIAPAPAPAACPGPPPLFPVAVGWGSGGDSPAVAPRAGRFPASGRVRPATDPRAPGGSARPLGSGRPGRSSTSRRR